MKSINWKSLSSNKGQKADLLYKPLAYGGGSGGLYRGADGGGYIKVILRKAVEWGRIEDSPARVVKTDSVQECRSPQEHRHQGIAVYDAEITPALARSLSERHQIELYRRRSAKPRLLPCDRAKSILGLISKVPDPSDWDQTFIISMTFSVCQRLKFAVFRACYG